MDEEIKQLIQMVLERGFLMSLATVDENGPWVSDVIYVFEEFDLYWLSDETRRHSKAILKNPKTAATITLCNKVGEDAIGIQLEGNAEKIVGENYKIALAHRLKRGKQPPEKDKPFLDPGEFWYKLKPTKIELIHEPKWGFNKKVFEIK